MIREEFKKLLFIRKAWIILVIGLILWTGAFYKTCYKSWGTTSNLTDAQKELFEQWSGVITEERYNEFEKSMTEAIKADADSPNMFVQLENEEITYEEFLTQINRSNYVNDIKLAYSYVKYYVDYAYQKKNDRAVIDSRVFDYMYFFKISPAIVFSLILCFYLLLGADCDNKAEKLMRTAQNGRIVRVLARFAVICTVVISTISIQFVIVFIILHKWHYISGWTQNISNWDRYYWYEGSVCIWQKIAMRYVSEMISGVTGALIMYTAAELSKNRYLVIMLGFVLGIQYYMNLMEIYENAFVNGHSAILYFAILTIIGMCMGFLIFVNRESRQGG